MAQAKANKVKIVARNDGQFKIRIVSSNGKTLAESDNLYPTRGKAKAAAKALAGKPLELDED